MKKNNWKKYGGNVYEGKRSLCYNIEMKEILPLYLKQLGDGESSPNHNMVIVGVKEYEDGRRFWKVENSWGIEAGKNGYYIMDEAYLERYAYEFIIHKKYLDDVQLKELEQKPAVLDFQDPLGA